MCEQGELLYQDRSRCTLPLNLCFACCAAACFAGHCLAGGSYALPLLFVNDIGSFFCCLLIVCIIEIDPGPHATGLATKLHRALRCTRPLVICTPEHTLTTVCVTVCTTECQKLVHCQLFCSAGGLTPAAIATAVSQAQAAHNAAIAAMHAHSFAAIEAYPDSQGTAAAAAKTPVDSAAAAASHLAAEAAASVAAADAGAVLAADAAAQTVQDKAVCQEACTPKDMSPHHADQKIDQMGLGWHPLNMQGQQHQHGDKWLNEEQAQNTFLPRIAEMQPGIKAETEQAQQAEEEGASAQQAEDADRSIPELGDEEEYRKSLDQAHGTNQICVGQDRLYTTETTCNALLQQQLDRIRQSAVMLPEPAEVLVTDLIDHR